MMLHFVMPSKLRTKKIVFEDVYPAHDSATLEHLKELSSRRKAIEESINESSSVTDAIAREMAGGSVSRYEQDIYKIEQYLPLLENLFQNVENLPFNQPLVHRIASLNIRWSIALFSSSFFNFKGPSFFQIGNLGFELVMTLFLYGGILRERALEVLSADLVQSATIFRQAAGVYHHAADELSKFNLVVYKLTQEKATEALAPVFTIMSLICLAEAQAVAIRKAEEKGTSSSLLAKLHHGVTLFLEEAAQIFHTIKCKDISTRLLDFICFSKCLHELKGKQYLAESLKESGQVGAAIGVLSSALNNVKKKIPGEETWKSTYQMQIQDASEVLRKLKRENDFVWHEKIPSKDNLPLPQRSKIVTFIPYRPKNCEKKLVFKQLKIMQSK